MVLMKVQNADVTGLDIERVQGILRASTRPLRLAFRLAGAVEGGHI